jgi:hypothetical protein
MYSGSKRIIHFISFVLLWLLCVNIGLSNDLLNTVNKLLLQIKYVEEAKAQYQKPSEGFDTEDALIVSKDGRELRARILGYDDQTLRFYSEEHQREFTTSFENLSDQTTRTIQNECPKKFLQLSSGWEDAKHHGEEETSIYDLATVLDMSFGSGFSYGSYTQSRKNGETIERLKDVYVREPFNRLDFSGDIPGNPTYIYGRISYLMDVEDARETLGSAIEMGSSQPITFPGFPDNSFSVWIFPIDEEYRRNGFPNDLDKLSGYDSIGLAVDQADQVVAVQLNRTSNCDEPGLKIRWSGSRRTTTYNFLESKKRFAARAIIGVGDHRSLGPLYTWVPEWDIEYVHLRYGYDNMPPRKSSVNAIETSFTTSSAHKVSYHRLFLPERIARILSYNIGRNWLPREQSVPQLELMSEAEFQGIKYKLLDAKKELESSGEPTPF